MPLDVALAQFDRTSVADRVSQAKDDIERTQRDFPETTGHPYRLSGTRWAGRTTRTPSVTA